MAMLHNKKGHILNFIYNWVLNMVLNHWNDPPSHVNKDIIDHPYVDGLYHPILVSHWGRWIYLWNPRYQSR